MKLAIAALLGVAWIASADKRPDGAKSVKIDYTFSSFCVQLSSTLPNSTAT